MATALAAVGSVFGGGAAGAAAAGAAAGAVGSAAIGAWSSNKASKRALQGQREAQAANQQAYGQARRDLLGLYDKSTEGRERAFRNTLGFLSGAPARQIAPLQTGNQAAQQTLRGGLDQTMAAILGRPIDPSAIPVRSMGSPEQYNFDLAEYMPAQPTQQTPAAGQIDPAILRSIGGSLSFGGPYANMPNGLQVGGNYR